MRKSWLALAVAVLVAAACDDQVKRVPWFQTMNRQPSVETYEAEPVPPPEGSVPLGAERHLDLATADTALTNPVASSAGALERGRILYTQFCSMCHGEAGMGDGNAVGENRFPAGFITMNLTRADAAALSDGYIFGIIGNGRGLMPSYRRIPAADRWYLVHYVRELQGVQGQ
jgi:mono/diheme cytochrome c family protein